MADRRRSAPVARAEVRCFPPGQRASGYEPGDFVLTRGDDWASRLAWLGQKLRFQGPARWYTAWDHAAVVVSPDGELVEARGRSVVRTPISRYDGAQVHLVHVGASAEDREHAVAFARWAADGPARLGPVRCAGLAWSLLTGGRFAVGFPPEATSAGLVARALERTGAIFDRPPAHVVPADLAAHYGVEPPCEHPLGPPPTMGHGARYRARPHRGVFPGIPRDEEPVSLADAAGEPLPAASPVPPA